MSVRHATDDPTGASQSAPPWNVNWGGNVNVTVAGPLPLSGPASKMTTLSDVELPGCTDDGSAVTNEMNRSEVPVDAAATLGDTNAADVVNTRTATRLHAIFVACTRRTAFPAHPMVHPDLGLADLVTLAGMPVWPNRVISIRRAD